jgi:carboxypeptidase M
MRLNIYCRLLVVSLLLVVDGNNVNSLIDFKYHNYVELTSLLKSYANKFPNQTHLYSIGKSVQGRELWAMAIAHSQPHQNVLLRPEAKYVGNIHGNEVPSKEVLLHLIDYLLNNQNSDENVDYLLRNTRIHILPSMNPDGFEVSTSGQCTGIVGRTNANLKDLNRNFPDLFECNDEPLEPESRAIVEWLNSNNFILSASFHGGTVVVNYPFVSIIKMKSLVMFSYSKYFEIILFIKNKG